MVENPTHPHNASRQPPHPAADFTKLDLFATAAMHSLLLADKGISTDRLAIDAYKIAQAMVERSERVTQPRGQLSPGAQPGPTGRASTVPL